MMFNGTVMNSMFDHPINLLYSLFTRSTMLFLRIWTTFRTMFMKRMNMVNNCQAIRYIDCPVTPLLCYRLNFVTRKILVLDLDETLIHSQHELIASSSFSNGGSGDEVVTSAQQLHNTFSKDQTITPDFIVKLSVDNQPVKFLVYKRPFVDYFLEMTSRWYDLVVFTASMEIYGSVVSDSLDNGRGILSKRYYRQHCKFRYGTYCKDLSIVSSDLSKVIIIDNSPTAYRSFMDNAIPISSWFFDQNDQHLLHLLPLLDSLRFTADVRSILGRLNAQRLVNLR